MKRCWEMAFMEHPTLLCLWVTQASLALPLHTGFPLFSGSIKVQASPFWPLTPCSTSFPITCDFPDFDPHTMIPFHYPVISLPIWVRASWLQVEARVSLERPAMGSGWGQDFSDGGGASFLQDEVVDLSWTCPLLNVFYLSLHLSVIIIIVIIIYYYYYYK